MAGPERLPLLPTTLVGSYPQPDWLVDRDVLAGRLPPRVRAREIWRVPEPFLRDAQDDATRLAVLDQERAGIDIVTDGEIRRESYSNRFASALDGIDLERPATVVGRSGLVNEVPRIVGRIVRRHPVEVNDVRFLRSLTTRRIKMTLPGPFTMLQQASNEWYADEADAAMDYAAAVNAEVRDLFAAGADVVQIDEPYMQAAPDKARSYGLQALDRALDGVEGTTCVHLCFGYAAMVKDRPGRYAFLSELATSRCDQVSIETAQSRLDCSVLRDLERQDIVLGVIDLSTHTVETPDVVADRIRRALPFVPVDRLVVAPDCGMKYLPRDIAFGKLSAMVEGAGIVRREVG